MVKKGEIPGQEGNQTETNDGEGSALNQLFADIRNGIVQGVSQAHERLEKIRADEETKKKTKSNPVTNVKDGKPARAGTRTGAKTPITGTKEADNS